MDNVINLTGGITAWEQEGFKLVKNEIEQEETIV